MINVSQQFKDESLKNRAFYVTAKCTLANGTVLNMEKGDFYNAGNGIVDSADSSDFPIGVAIEKTATLTLVNDDDRFSGYDFGGSRFVIYLNLQMSDRLETIKRGTFVTVKKPATSEKISLTLADHMYLADREYSSNLLFPATSGEVLRDACQTCGIMLGDASFTNDDYIIQEKPSSTTFRAVIGDIALISGGNARIDEDDRLRILNFQEIDENLIDARTFTTVPQDTIDAGTFDNPSENVIDAGTFRSWSDIHVLQFINNLQYDTDDVVVTGVQTTVDEQTYFYGKDGYVLTFDSPFVSQSPEDALQRIGDIIIGLRMRPFSCQSIANAYATFMDAALVSDQKGRSYFTYITNVDFQFNGYTTFSNDAQSAEELNTEYYSGNSVIVEQSKKETEKLLSAYDIAVQNMNQLAANTLGFYYKQVVNEDGSITAYRHDKPLLADSKIVYKSGIDGFFVTNDYQGTDEATSAAGKWSSGFDSNGDAVLNILYAIGIQSDWINTRGLTAKDNEGNVTFRVNADDGSIEMVVKSFSLSGKTIEEIAQDNLSDFVDAVYTPEISNLQSQIDGQIETWFYNYIPSNDNVPANQWTSDTEKDKHLGDLFYIVDNEENGGQAYRWAKVGNEYKWDYVEDTATTKALADAAKAQDTADSKRRVFVTTPQPPYDVGDLWVGNTSSDLMRCQTARQSGTYVSSDWIKAVKYTDNSALNEFISGDYAQTIEDLKTQADQKAETWYQETDPSTGWSTEEKQNHKGDLWYNTSDQNTYIYNGTSWEETKSTPPDEVFDKIDGKAQIFITQPTPPYNAGDLWFNGTTSGIMTCINSRESGDYTASDWEERNKYTDDSYAESVKEDLNLFTDKVTEEISSINKQIDGKIETFYYDYQPTLTNIPASEWTTDDEKEKHIGDMFFWKSKGYSYVFQKDNNVWSWNKITDSDINEALQEASNAQDTADGKRRVFISTPQPPYDAGDLWWTSTTNGEAKIKVCKTARQSGTYVSSDWIDNSYANSDDIETAITEYDTSLGQTEVFNKLTGGGANQGIYIQDGKLYINADYILSGTLAGQRINAKGMYVYGESGQITFGIDSRGNVTIRANSFSLQGSTIQSIANNAANAAANNALSSAKEYTDSQLADFSPDVNLTQQQIFNILTNNGQTQGIYLSGGRIYINASYIDTGYLADWEVRSTSLYASSGYNSVTLDGGNGRIRTTGDFEVYGGPGYAEMQGNRVYADLGKFYSLEIDGDASVRNLDASGRTRVYGLSSFFSGKRVIMDSDDNVTLALELSSSIRYKNHIRELTDEEANRILKIPIVWYTYKEQYISEKDRFYNKPVIGMYAEDVHKNIPEASQLNEDGTVEDWNYRVLIPLLIKEVQINDKIIKQQQKEIETLKSNQSKILQALSKAGIEVEL